MLAMLLSGCASNILEYSPKLGMNAQDAWEVVDELTMTQHLAWRPVYIEFKERYVVWGRGVTTRGLIGGSRSRESQDRIYYKSIDRIQLMSWRRKLEQYYVVSIVRKDDSNAAHILHTRSLVDAKRFLDAFETLLAVHR